MILLASNAGAKRSPPFSTRFIIALSVLFCQGTAAAELRLLRADQAEVRATMLPLLPGGVAQDTLQLNLDVGLERHELRLRPKLHLGALAQRVRSRATAYEGRLAGRAGSWVAVTRIGNRWTGIWFDGTHYFGLESAAALAPISTDAARSAPDRTLVFRLADAIWTGTDLGGDTLRPPRTLEGVVDQVGAALNSPASALASLPTKRLSVALLADSELALRDGAQTETNMLAWLNFVDGIFSAQVGVQLRSDSVTIFNAGNQPFTSTTAGTTLLEELSAYRSGVSGAAQRVAGLSHLFTGRDLDGTTVGIAYLDSLCSSRFAASLSEARSSATFAGLVAAHEIAHAFGAPHDTESGSACETTPSGFLMSAQLSGSQTLSACSLERMATAVTAAQCLAPADAADASLEAPAVLPLALNRTTNVTIGVNSVGNVAVNGVNLRITLPASVTLVSAGGASCSSAGSIVNCALGSIAANGSAMVTLAVVATAAGSPTIALRLTATNDGLASNNTANIVVQAEEGTDMVTTATAAPADFAPGASTTAVFTLENAGPASVTDARLGLVIPGGVVITGQTLENTGCAAVTNGLSCGPTLLAPGSSMRVTLTLRGDVAGTPAIQATGSSSRPELQPLNNDAQLVLVVRTPVPAQTLATPSKGGGGLSLPWLAGLAALCLARAGRSRRQKAQARAK